MGFNGGSMVVYWNLMELLVVQWWFNFGFMESRELELEAKKTCLGIEAPETMAQRRSLQQNEALIFFDSL